MNPQRASGRPEEDTASGSSPVKPQRALVQCEGYRCLAFRDADGSWKDSRDQPVKVVKVLQEL